MIKYFILLFVSLNLMANEQDYSFFYDHFPSMEQDDPFEMLSPVEPYNWQTWYKDFFAHDEKGILLRVKNQILSWQEQEKYVKQWNLESTGQIPLPTEKEKRKFIFRHLLKYGDYKLSRAARESEEDSTIKKVAELRETLKPSGTINIVPDFKLRLNARLLEGFVTARLQNPFFENELYIDARGHINLFASKDFEILETSLIYEFKEKKWMFKINKNLLPNLNASLISTQPKDQLLFSNESDQMIQFLYNYIY